MTGPDPKDVVLTQLRAAKADIATLRGKGVVPNEPTSALLSLHTAVQHLAKVNGIDEQESVSG
jgi:hypothetical protein